MAKKRQISEEEKGQVIEMQKGTDGSLRCYISGDVLDVEKDEVEYDHILAFADGGPSDINNVRVFRKKFNKEKGKMSLLEYKEFYSLKRLYESKQNKVKLQDIFGFKGIEISSFYATVQNGKISLTDGSSNNRSYELLHDSKLNVQYFYDTIPKSV